MEEKGGGQEKEEEMKEKGGGQEEEQEREEEGIYLFLGSMVI